MDNAHNQFFVPEFSVPNWLTVVFLDHFEISASASAL